MQLRKTLTTGLFAAACLVAVYPDAALASQPSTHFSLFVPPNNSNNGRHSTLTVTAIADNTAVTITDTADDGDSDDSTSATLSKGQSIVVRVRDGAVNDGAGGIWDGDNFIVDADKPVTAMLSTRSEWQHDWVPAENNTMRGQEFFVWTPRPNWDIDVVAYEDDTVVEIYDITSTAQESSGTTSVTLPGEKILEQTLSEGTDLLVTLNKSGTNITEAGHSYRVVASKPATMMYGSFERRSRDGGGQVPSEDGTPMGSHFYFAAPAERWAQHEREIRIVAGDAATDVTLRGWTGSGWTDIDTQSLGAYGHLDYTGRDNDLVRAYKFFEVEATNPVSVFEGNWLETGSYGTSDVWSWVAALDSVGASDVGQEFVAYVGPPGLENNAVGVAGQFSHLYVTSFAADTDVTVTDVDTGGTIVNQTLNIANADDIVDFRITVADYNAMNDPGNGRRPYLQISADNPVSVASTNWNDNWLSFASGTLPPGISVDIDADETMTCNTSADYTITTTNTGSATLTDVELELSALGNANLLSTVSDIPSLAPGASDVQVVTIQVSCTNNTTPLSGISIIASDPDATETTTATAKSENTPVFEPAVPRLRRVNTTPDACAIEVNFWTDNDEATTTYNVLRREFGDPGAYTEVGEVTSLGDSDGGFFYTYRDNSVDQNTQYQYMVQAEAPDTTELALAGPSIAVAELPFAESPASTGDVAADFASIGETFTDVTDDITSTLGTPPGYDVDRVGAAYDQYNDRLYLSVSTVGIFGDGDGDGDPDTNTIGSSVGLTDQANWEGDETFVFIVDFDGNGDGDAVVGLPVGADFDMIQAAPMNDGIGLASPGLAFDTPSLEQSQLGAVEVLNAPAAGAPDLELVLHNASLYADGGTITDLEVGFYLAAPSISGDTEWFPASETLNDLSAEAVTASCGEPPSQLHMGTFAAFGNIFTGTPDFEFVPFGWYDNDDATTLAAAPTPVDDTVITSPTVFLSKADVDIDGTLSPLGLDLTTQDVRVQDTGFVSGDNFVHRSEIDWTFSAAEGDERYENIDLQVFRMFVLDCTTTVTIEQFGTSGVLRDSRDVLLADGTTVSTISAINPALTLAHSGLGTFEVDGAMNRLNFATPEDWVSDFGSAVDPAFTEYAFLDDVNYLGSVTPETTTVTPLGETGITLPAGIWFVNHYVWTYANEGSSRIETTFEPGADCGGSL